MKSITLLAGGLLALFLAGGAAAQFNPEALKKMQKQGHKIVEEQKAVEAPAVTGAAIASKTAKARTVYRIEPNLCLVAENRLAVESCDRQTASQQWAFDASGRLVAHDGRCVDGASLVPCAGRKTQKWVHDKRGRLRNQAQQCLQPRKEESGTPVAAVACSGASQQVWAGLTPSS